MNWMKFSVSNRSVFTSVVAALMVAILFYGPVFLTVEASRADLSPEATFPANAATLGAIPDGDCSGPGRQVTFTASGLSGAPSEVSLSITFGPTHTWVGDLDIILTAPNGTSFDVFTFTNPGGTGSGDSSNVTGPYVFTDSATNNWWTAAASVGDAGVIPAGSYRTAAPNGANSNFTAAYAGVTNPNGTWTMKVNDCAPEDTGGISAASLTINTGGGGMVQQHVVDYDGDGRTDASVVRNTGGGVNGQTTWFHDLSSVANPAGVYQQQWGLASDDFVPADYDGDDKTDIAVWRSGPPFGSFFYIFQSSNNTLRTDVFGQAGDYPYVTADYTGDGRDDPAVYRAGAAPNGQSFWFYRASSGPLNGQIVYTQFGQAGDTPAPGDYNGDGRADFCVRRNNGGGQGVFIRRNGTGGGDPGGNADSVVVFGAPTDFIVPGDYDGDRMTDIATTRVSGTQLLWSIRLSSNSSVVTQFWGIAATDLEVPGDYNGDGRTDLAVWRPNADPTQNFFFPFSIPNGKLPPIEWGQNGDYPVAFSYVHF